MLRHIIGEEYFFKVLKEYCSDPSFRYKNASTQDLIDKVTSVTGTNLAWFFKQWLSTPNHPVYENHYEIKQAGSDKWEVSYTFKQIQKENYFKMPVELRFFFKDLGDTTVVVNNNSQNQNFKFLFDREPLRVQFDPDRNIVLKEVLKEY
jgi:aminopeptidase N